MPLPSIHGIIDRRLLVNYRADPAIVARLLPAPFRPQVIDGHAVVGICLIRLRALRPRFVPAWAGLGSENAAHRFAVAWDGPQGEQTGVYIPRRDTSSRLNTVVGGRLFPGIHHLARFTVDDQGEVVRIGLHSKDQHVSVQVVGRHADVLPTNSVFGSLARASEFFAKGSLGWSPTHHAGVLQGLELRCERWLTQPLAVEAVQSSYFDDPRHFPSGSITFDHALIMRDIAHVWHSQGKTQPLTANCA